MGSFSQLPQNLQSLQGAVTNAGQTEQPKFGQPQQPIGQPQTQDITQFDQLQASVRQQPNEQKSSSYPNTINQWDNSPQSPINTIGKGSSTASSKLPSPLTNNSPFGGSGKGA